MAQRRIDDLPDGSFGSGNYVAVDNGTDASASRVDTAGLTALNIPPRPSDGTYELVVDGSNATWTRVPDPLPIDRGGTNAETADDARTELGVDSSAEVNSKIAAHIPQPRTDQGVYELNVDSDGNASWLPAVDTGSDVPDAPGPDAPGDYELRISNDPNVDPEWVLAGDAPDRGLPGSAPPGLPTGTKQYTLQIDTSGNSSWHDRTIVPLTEGGTGATDAEGARTNLDVDRAGAQYRRALESVPANFVKFDGRESEATIPYDSAQDFGTDGWTVSIIARGRHGTVGSAQTLIGSQNSSPDGWKIYLVPGNTPYSGLAVELNGPGVVQPVSLADRISGEAYAITVVYNPNFGSNGVIEAYVNGEIDGIMLPTQDLGSLTTGSPICIGHLNGTEHFEGDIFSVNITKRPLTADEVKALFENANVPTLSAQEPQIDYAFEDSLMGWEGHDSGNGVVGGITLDVVNEVHHATITATIAQGTDGVRRVAPDSDGAYVGVSGAIKAGRTYRIKANALVGEGQRELYVFVGDNSASPDFQTLIDGSAGPVNVWYDIEAPEFKAGGDELRLYYGVLDSDGNPQINDYTTSGVSNPYSFNYIEVEDITSDIVALGSRGISEAVWHDEEIHGLDAALVGTETGFNSTFASSRTPSAFDLGKLPSNGYVLNGATSQLTIADGDSVKFGTGDYSWVGVIHAFDDNSDEVSIVDKRDSTGAGWDITLDDKGRLKAFVHDGTNSATTEQTGLLDLRGNPRHIAVVFNRTSNQLIRYVNGRQYGETLDISGLTDATDNPQDLKIGYGNHNSLNGLIYNSHLYNYALTPSYVNDHYNSGSDPRFNEQWAAKYSGSVYLADFQDEDGWTGGSGSTLAASDGVLTWTANLNSAAADRTVSKTFSGHPVNEYGSYKTTIGRGTDDIGDDGSYDYGVRVTGLSDVLDAQVFANQEARRLDATGAFQSTGVITLAPVRRERNVPPGPWEDNWTQTGNLVFNISAVRIQEHGPVSQLESSGVGVTTWTDETFFSNNATVSNAVTIR